MSQSRISGIIASSIAFAALLSILPMLSLIALTYGTVVPRDVVAANIGKLVDVLPSNALHLVSSWLTNSLARRHTDGLAVLLSAALTLLSARRAGRSLLHGINVASGTEQDRGTPARQITSLVAVLALAALLLTGLVSITVQALIKHPMPTNLMEAEPIFNLLPWGSLTLGSIAALLINYRSAAAKQPIGWRWVFPGTGAAVLLCLGTTLPFLIYVANVASYQSNDGSLSAVIVLQLWLMLSAYILLLGARLNAETMRTAGVLSW